MFFDDIMTRSASSPRPAPSKDVATGVGARNRVGRVVWIATCCSGLARPSWKGISAFHSAMKEDLA